MFTFLIAVLLVLPFSDVDQRELAVFPLNATGSLHDVDHLSNRRALQSPHVYANFKMNTLEGGERGVIYVDGEEVWRRSNFPVAVGERAFTVNRSGYTLMYAEINGRIVRADANNIVMIDLPAKPPNVRIVFTLKKTLP